MLVLLASLSDSTDWSLLVLASGMCRCYQSAQPHLTAAQATMALRACAGALLLLSLQSV